MFENDLFVKDKLLADSYQEGSGSKRENSYGSYSSYGDEDYYNQKPKA